MRIGILGAGLIGCEHLSGLADLFERKILNGALCGVFDPDQDRAEAARAKFSIERTFKSAEELIGQPELDALFITAWTGAHHHLVDLCCQAGKPVFCEKPLARNLDEARSMERLVKDSRTPNQIGLILRTSPAYGFVRQLCQREELGRLMVVNFRDDQYFPIQGRYGSRWRSDPDQAGGGTFIEHSIHDVDLMRWMFGEFSTIQASTDNFAGHRGIEDLALVNANLKSGGRVVFTSIWHQILSRQSTRFLEVFFERGRISVAQEVFGPVTLEMGDGAKQTFEQAQVVQWYLQHNQDLLTLGLNLASPQEVEDYRFLKALEEGRQPEPGFSEAVAAHQVVEAAYRSASQGHTIELPLG